MVEISSRDKLLFPEAAVTKGELVDYYRTVAPAMLPHLSDRPLTLQRFPNGINQPGFMQKNAPPYFPEYITRCRIDKKDGETVHPVVHDRDGLLYLANQNTIAFHAPTSRASNLFSPDRLIFDLDPSPGRVDDARRVARLVKQFLDQLALPSFPMTTGSKGFHVVTPLDQSSSQEVAAEVAQSIAVLTVAHSPDLATLEFLKEKRNNRVFMDWMRNAYVATAVVAWSVRPRPHAPIAMPITWEELEEVEPDQWTIRNGLARLDAHAWDRFEEAASLDGAHASLRRLLEEQHLELDRFDRFRS